MGCSLQPLEALEHQQDALDGHGLAHAEGNPAVQQSATAFIGTAA